MNFENLRNSYINLIQPVNFSRIILQSPVLVESPLRVNLSAGWNDTPPYCNEVVGYTLNAPILLNNNFPIRVTIRKIEDSKIVLKNIDNNTSISIKNYTELLDCQSPSSNFALHKSAILASGLIPFDKNYNLNNYFNTFGGFELSTSVTGIPVGSGLGTSSILLYSCINAIYKYIGIEISNLDLFNMTACAEQIMTTGGGYQDQIGAYCKDFKFISFAPSIYPNIICENLQLSNEVKVNLQNRLAYIYTGNTRVAKDLLQRIMENYINKNSSTIETLHEIGLVARDMKNNLINSDLISFAKNMTRSFNLNVKLNPNFTNDNIQNILNCINNLIDGYMLSGAGNGGFLTVILKKGFSKEELNNIINSNFKSSNVVLYNFELYF